MSNNQVPNPAVNGEPWWPPVPLQTPPPVPAQRVVDQLRKPQVVYTRAQTGHSLILHLTLGAVVLWIPALYITLSPRHYWHA